MTSNDELKFFGNPREITHYRDQATKIEYPDVAQASPTTVTGAEAPRRVRHPKKENVVDLTLEEALRTALLNAEVLRDSGQFLNPGNRLLSNPDFATSIYDVAIQESNQLFGQGGVQAALAEFDATLTANMMWGRNENAVDTATTGFAALSGQNEEFADARAQLSKIFGDGGQVTLQHNVFYSENNMGIGGRPFNSQFSSRPSSSQDGGLPMVGMEYRLPVLQGAGREYTSIAGPVARRPTLQSTPVTNQGVVVARIRTDISISEFEASVAQLLHDTEDLYWQLHLSYRTYDAETVATKSAVQTWREVRVNMDAGKVGAADEAQARDNYFESRARRESALSNLYQLELQLRRLMGIAVNEGSIYRPTDDPMTAELIADWNMTLTEALANRPELRRQKWNIKSLELQRTAAESLVKPRLDLVARYQMNGFGDKLTGGGGQPGTRAGHFRSAYDTLFNSEFQGWGAGFEFSMPLGFRGAVTQLQNLDHRIAKARAMLAQQEQEISYELGNVLQQIDLSYQTAKTNFNRRRAAERRVQAAQSEYEVGRTTLDLLLRAQISLSQADIAYYSSLVQYNRALNDLNFRKGSILVDRNVYLSESLWTEDAYADALRRAWVRSFAFDAPAMHTEPEAFAFDGSEYAMPGTYYPDYQEMPSEDSLPADVPAPLAPGEETPGIPKLPAFPDGRTAFNDGLPSAGGLVDPSLYDEPLPLPNDSEFEPGISSFTAESLDSSPAQFGGNGSVLPVGRQTPAVPVIDDSAFAPIEVPGRSSSPASGIDDGTDPFAPPIRISPTRETSGPSVDPFGRSKGQVPQGGNSNEFLPPISTDPFSSRETPDAAAFREPIRPTSGASRRQLLDTPPSRAN